MATAQARTTQARTTQVIPVKVIPAIALERQDGSQ